MLIGAHVSTRGGVDRAIDNAVSIGADVFQIHPSPPQQWRQLVLDDESVALFTSKLAASGRSVHYLHAAYLVNLASPRETLLRQSMGSLVHSMHLAHRLGAAGVVFHPGSHVGSGLDQAVPRIGAAMREVLARAESPTLLIVENSAGAGSCVGGSVAELARIVEAAGSDRVAVCLDTAHLHAAGCDIRSPELAAALVESFSTVLGLDRLAVVHANDSRSPLGSGADRHANIGEGEIGAGPFRRLLADPRLRRVPWILEVPGEQGKGPDRANVNRLRDCAGLPPVDVPTPAPAASS